MFEVVFTTGEELKTEEFCSRTPALAYADACARAGAFFISVYHRYRREDGVSVSELIAYGGRRPG